MKRFLSVLCTLLMAISCFAGFTAFAQDDAPIRGDVNDDGKLDIVDVALTRAYIIGNVKFTVPEFARAEMNSDGLVDIIDVAMMRHLIITGGGIYDESGLDIQTTELFLNKGACALVYVNTNEPTKLKFESSSDLFEIKSGMDVDNGLIAVAVFANETAKSDKTGKVKVFLEGNENNAKYIDVTVLAKDNLAEYYNHPGVPDFGTVCGITPDEVSINGATYSYHANKIASIHGEKKMVEMYERYGDILEDYGYSFTLSYNVSGGGEVLNYVSHDKTIGIEFGSMPDPKDPSQWYIVLGITELK